MDINNFGPFNVNTWGSVSDWAMVIVTAITAFYLFRTLKSQMKVQDLQQKSFDLENTNNIYSIKPQLKAEFVSMLHESSEHSGYSHLGVLKFFLKDANTATNIYFKSNPNDIFKIPPNIQKQELVPGSALLLKIYTNPVTSKVLVLTNDDFLIFFSDIRGHEYMQNIRVTISYGIPKVNLSFPKKV